MNKKSADSEMPSISFREKFGEDSYTSWQDENIYENLNFDFYYNLNENETVLENESLYSWLYSLSMDSEDYESSDFMMTKSIPSLIEAKRSRQNTNESETDSSERQSSLDAFKLEILNKCFASIWRQDSEDKVMTSLYTFLNDVFSMYFKKAKNSHSKRNCETIESERHNIGDVVVRRQKKLRVNYDPASRRSSDNGTAQKLETFILSVTLNRATITYDKCMSFYFLLKNSQALDCFDSDFAEILKFSQFYIETNRRRYKIKSRRDLNDFIRLLEVVLLNSLCEPVSVNAIEGVKSETNELEENIYQPIWNWYTDSNSDFETNIYEPLRPFEGENDDWTLDSEFCFYNARNQALVKAKENMFRTICILYSDEDAELNQILYSYNSCDIVKDTSIAATEQLARDESLNVIKSQKPVEKARLDLDVVASVIEWKNLIRQPYYLEDEEDLMMSETQIASIKLYQPSPDESNVLVPDNETPVVMPKNKLLSISNGSYELKSAQSDSSIQTSLHGQYRIKEPNDSSHNSADSVMTIEEPKKERLRDKFRAKLKLSSNKNSNTSLDNIVEAKIEAQKEMEMEYFSPSLETVEKDSENVLIPKIVVECVSILDTDQNIVTPGIYRVSGNKTFIEGFKKKSNDKKATKKEPTSALLRNQDVHNIAGILKLFFRELSSPLMPPKVFGLCAAENQRSESVAAILKEMPQCNYETLKYLMGHLKRIELKREENLMNSGNLAICWGLCLFQSSSAEDPGQFFENHIAKCNMLCKKLIDNYETIFR